MHSLALVGSELAKPRTMRIEITIKEDILPCPRIPPSYSSYLFPSDPVLRSIGLPGQLGQEGLPREERQLGGRGLPRPLPARTPGPNSIELKKGLENQLELKLIFELFFGQSSPVGKFQS